MSATLASPARTAATAASRPSLAGLIAAWRQRRRTRAALARLDEHLLRDIGLTEAAQTHEVRKPFWAL